MANAGQILKLRNRLALMTKPEFGRVVAEKCGAAAMRFALDGFKSSSDPYGRPWAPVGRLGKKLTRGRVGPRRLGKPLIDTGALRQSVTMDAAVGRFRIGFSDRIAGYHQTGTRGRLVLRRTGLRRLFGIKSRVGAIPRRQMIPEASTGGIPAKWREKFAQIINAEVRKQITGAA
ncbi:MAG TPA: phage virion morphogenesis protein [Gemmatimonadales bacterium]|nr:phage virion morphogenesis protein [Gemmatimonadales bacterium]